MARKGRPRGRPRKNPPAASTPVGSRPLELQSAGQGSGIFLQTPEQESSSKGKEIMDGTSSFTPMAEGISSKEELQNAEVNRKLEMSGSPAIINEHHLEKGARQSKGMKLGYVAPTLKNGIPVACLQKSDVESENEKWKTAVILYVIGDSPTITYLNTYLVKQCGLSYKPEIFYHNDNYFVIRFNSLEDRDGFMCLGPHTIANRPVIVKVWDASFCFEKEILKVIPLWIQLPNLPLNCWGAQSLSRIGSIIGKPICTDECTSSQNRISFARLLVEVDVTQPVQHKILIEGENGTRIEQKVIYDWFPPFCKTCQVVGHDCNTKGKPQWPVPQKQQWKVKATAPEVQHQIKPVEKGPVITSIKGKEKKDIVDEEGWSKPKKTTTHSGLPARTESISTTNSYEVVGNGVQQIIQGGDLFPFGLE